jgi:ferrous iron transport protein B
MWKSLSLRLMDRAKAFLFRAGTVILGVSILLWALTYLPMHNGQPPQIADSAISKIGHFIEPAIRPLGFNWKIGVGLLSSFAAREVIIATMGTLHGVDPQSHAMALQEALKSDLSPAGAIALLVFFAFAMQCMSTMAVVQRETNSWKWPILQFLYMTTVAYVAAFAAYRVTLLFWN